MEPKVIKHYSKLFKQEFTLTIDENLNNMKGKVGAPEKLAQANETLIRLKDKLPKR